MKTMMNEANAPLTLTKDHTSIPKTDPIVLAADCVIDGGIGHSLPNYNVMVVGCSGTGKSLSVNYPTMFEMNNASLIATFAKSGEARDMAEHFRQKGYHVQICDLANPEQSDVSFDPMKHLHSYDDIVQLANDSVMGIIQKTVDDYWQRKAAPLLGSLIAAAKMTRENPSFSDVLDLFNRMTLNEYGYGITTGLDSFFERLKEKAPDSYAVREFYNFRSLPVKTASCVRDTLAACLSSMYPESLRKMMRTRKSINFKMLGTEKTALFIITSATNTSLNCFANMIYNTGIKELLEYAAECPGYRLPREVRLVFDDFAVGSKIANFASHVAIFRSAGVSAVVLLQSESQLYSIYGEQDALTILNNMATYCYFSGGMDLTTCEHVARRINKPLDTVLYSPMDRVYIMQAGKKPRITKRYPILTDQRFIAMKQGARRDTRARA